MSLDIRYVKVSDAKTAFESVKKNITPETLGKFNVSADFEYLEDEARIIATGKGFDLVMKFAESHANLDLKLSFLLRPLKGQILSILEKEIKRVL